MRNDNVRKAEEQAILLIKAMTHRVGDYRTELMADTNRDLMPGSPAWESLEAHRDGLEVILRATRAQITKLLNTLLEPKHAADDAVRMAFFHEVQGQMNRAARERAKYDELVKGRPTEPGTRGN